jgi:Calcineurin-like phosphoesterase
MPKPHIVAILCADLHLTLKRPACRADDEDWMDVQAGYLRQLKDLAGKLPVLCAGDIFDRWNASPELINFALKHLPDGMICVPGQHDLPNHRLDLMHRSGYGVLVQSKKIRDVSGSILVPAGVDMAVYGFGWNEEIEPLPPNDGKRAGVSNIIVHVALVHRYIWTADKCYPGAPAASNITGLKKVLQGYDVAVFGDNHKGFLAQVGGCRVLNCGGFIRRKSDEIDYEPKIGILHSDGSVMVGRLGVSQDKFHPQAKEREETPVNMKEFIDSLEGLGEQGLDFRAAVRQHLQSGDLKKSVRKLIEEIME